MDEFTNNKRRILVIEDEPIICRVCKKILDDSGFEVDIAANGLVGMEMANCNYYDLYFSDIRTPAMNGIQFYEYLNQRDRRLSQRVILTTGDVMSPDIKAFLSKNYTPFILKPFTPDDLRNIVKKTLDNLFQVLLN
jgi:two-component system, sensor histidine kinase and response regulator